MKALVSVFDKAGVVDLGRKLNELQVDLLSSGGTAGALAGAGVPVTEVADYTGFPEMPGGLVKTLHPKIHAGILADRDNPEHMAYLEEHEINPIDIVVVNLYPFSSDPSIHLIDIGGPTMLRAAAKNHKYVTVLVDPADYDGVLEELKEHGHTLPETRKRLAAKVFATTAAYDVAIAEWMGEGDYAGYVGEKVQDCDYGENRWQSPAALYRTLGRPEDPLGLSSFELVAGRLPSFINWTDCDRLLQTATRLVAGHIVNNSGKQLKIAIAVKHGNACGAAVGEDEEEVLKDAVTGDKKAVFGSVIITNFPITLVHAQILSRYDSEGKRLIDGLCAPAIDKKASDLLARKDGKFFHAVNPALATLGTDSLDQAPLDRQVRGGFLRQPNYSQVLDLSRATVEGDLGAMKEDLVTAWAIGATSNSNTVTLVRDGQLVGNGVGQQDRVSCCELALKKAADAGHATWYLEGAGDKAQVVYFFEGSPTGVVAYSDSFFPYDDGPTVLVKAGVEAIFSTTGSKKDPDTQRVCRDAGVVLAQLPDAEARGFFRH